MRLFSVAAILVLLGGCAIPPALNIASLAIDGISLAATGKTVPDHALSAVADKDCALWRIIKGTSVCIVSKLEAADTVMVADASTVESWRLVSQPAATGAVTEEGAEPTQIALAPTTSESALSDAAAAAPGAIETPLRSEQPRRIQLVMNQEAGDWSLTDQFRHIPKPIDPVVLPADLAELMPVLGGVAVAPEQRVVRPNAFSVAPAPIVHEAPPPRPISLSAGAFEPTLYGSKTKASLEVAKFDTLKRKPVLSAPSRSIEKDAPALYLVLGSFRKKHQAQQVVEQHDSADFSVMTALVKGKTYYRVVTGPFQPARAKVLRREYIATGIKDAWLISL